MNDQDKSKQELIEELVEVRRRVAALETADTERKEAEETLRKSEARFRSVFHDSPVGIAVVTPNGEFIQVNEALCDFLGYSEPELIGRTVESVTHPDDREAASTARHQALTSGPCRHRFEKLYLHKGGQALWAEMTCTLIFDTEDKPSYCIAHVLDISERRRAEEALREKEDRFKLFMDNSPAIAWMKDERGRYVYFSKSYEKRIGIRLEDTSGKTDFDLWPGETAEQFWKNDQAVLASGQAIELIEESSVPNDGHCYWWNVKFPLQDSVGRRFVGGIGIDITEHRRTEEALREAHDELERRVKVRTAELAKANESLDIFRRFAEDSGEGFGMSDLDGRVVYANSTLCRMYGEEKPEDVVGKHVSAYYPAEYMQLRKEKLIPALLRHGHWHIEQTLLPRQGKTILTLQNTFLIRDDDGNPFRIGCVISDITEQKLAEEALRQSHDELQTIYNGITEGLLITDIETKRFVRVNRAMCRMLGYSTEELLAASIKDIHPPEEVPNDLQRFQAAAEGRVSLNEDRPVLRKDGSIFYSDITGHQVFYHDRPCLLALFRDITERKQAEEALRKQHRNLRHLLHSSDHERQLIAYEIHDGLSQQLAGALMQLQAFDHLKDKTPKDAAKAYDAAVTMLQQGHFETRRLIAGVRPPILDEAGVAEAISHLVHEQGREKGPKIEYHTRVDFDRLSPTLENAIYRIAQAALTNACTHSKSERISVSLLQREDRVRIVVRDWGVGFDPKAVPKKHFGLEGIRQRAKLLGGKCSIRSKSGRGTRISVELLVVPKDEEG